MPNSFSTTLVVSIVTCIVVYSADVCAQAPARPQRPQAGSGLSHGTAHASGVRPNGHARSALPAVAPQKLSPELTRILVNWSKASAGIKKLQGSHHRFVYDKVFAVEKWSEGKFYYESPDKGRIDITPSKVAKGQVGRNKDAKGQPFAVKSDSPEKWICDGKNILSIDEKRKTCDIFKIPEQAQGENIMHGPLPFLFGMPPEIAKKRYLLTLKKIESGGRFAQIEARPRWQQDAANWDRATIRLDLKTNLPTHVKLVDPAGNTETVYAFDALRANKNVSLVAVIFGGQEKNPFRPNLRNYNVKTHTVETIAQEQKQQQADVNAAKSPVPQRTKPVVPNLLGLDWKSAKTRASELKLKPSFLQGRASKNAKEVFRVYQQDPRPGANLPADGKIKLVLYTKPGTSAN